MGKGQKIALGIGIAAILAVFVGFLAWQVSDGAYTVCQEGKQEDSVCCMFTPTINTGEKSYFYWVGSIQECTGSIALNSECVGTYYYNEDCSDTQKQWFGGIAIIAGFVALVVGIIMSNNTVGGGLTGGAIICFIMGLIAYWEWIEGWLRVAFAGIILLGLIILGIVKMKD